MVVMGGNTSSVVTVVSFAFDAEEALLAFDSDNAPPYASKHEGICVV